MLEGRAGMMFMGSFLGELATDAAVHDDLDMFPFPLFGNEWDVERAIDAPLDGYMLSGSPKDVASAKKLLYCLSGGSAQALYLAANPNSVPAVSDPSTFWSRRSSGGSTRFSGTPWRRPSSWTAIRDRTSRGRTECRGS